jgi:hypothetical protein
MEIHMPDKATVDAWLSAASKTPDPVITPPAAVVPDPVIAPTVEDANDTPASSADDVSADPADPVEDGTSDATDDSSNSPADPSSDTPSGEQGDGKPRRSAAQERIEELVTERNAFRKYGEHLLAHIEELKKGATPPTGSTGTPPPAANADSGDEPPTLEQFKFDPVEFSKAQSKWLKDQVKKQVADTLAAARGQQDSAAATAKFIEREAVSRAAHPDFDLMTSKNPNFPKLDVKSADMIVKSELGTEIAYHLGKNPGLAARIEKMDRDSQIAAIGRIEGELAAKSAAPAPKGKPAPAQKTVTKAPPPPTSVRGSVNPTKQVHEMSMEEFAAHERAQKLAKREQSLKIRRAMR